jgi:hypothetical protein
MERFYILDAWRGNGSKLGPWRQLERFYILDAWRGNGSNFGAWRQLECVHILAARAVCEHRSIFLKCLLVVAF